MIILGYWWLVLTLVILCPFFWRILLDLAWGSENKEGGKF